VYGTAEIYTTAAIAVTPSIYFTATYIV